MSDDRRQSAVSQFFYDSNAGTVMGRTGRSWAKILLFYAIYYSFLAIIFFVSLETMKAISKPKSLGGRGFAPTQTRLDQPGLTVYPHQENRDDKDGLAYPICFNKTFEETTYFKDLEKFLGADIYNQKNIVGYTSPDVNKYTATEWKEIVKNSYENKTITVFLALNKVLNFELKGVSSLKDATGPYPFQHERVLEKDQFEKNSAYFNCLNLNDKGEITTGSNATVTIDLANPNVQQPGRISVNDYNKQNTKTTDVGESQNQFKNIAKPFVAFEIDFKDVKTGKNRFVCLPIAGNINNSEQNEFTREKYSKNGLGRLEFGFDVQDGNDKSTC